MSYFFIPFVFIAASSLSALLLSLLWGNLTPDIARFSLFAGTLYSGFCLWLNPPPVDKEFKKSDYVIFLLLFVLSLSYFLRIYFYKEGAWQTIELAFQKIPIFTSNVIAFMQGMKFWPAQNPLLLPERYHDFGFSFFMALPAFLGISFSLLIPFTAILLCFFGLFAFWKWAGKFGWGAYFCWTGMAGVILILRNFFPFLWNQISAANTLPSALGFFMGISEPSLWYAFPVCIILLWHFKEVFFHHRAGLSRPIEIILLGTLPLFCFQGFAWVLFISFYWALLNRKPSSWLQEIGDGLWIALPLILFISDFGKNDVLWGSWFFRFKDGGFDLAAFLFQYLYLLVPFLVAVWMAFGSKDRWKSFLWFFLPGAFSFCFFALTDTSAWVGSGLFLAALGLLLIASYFNEVMACQRPMLRGGAYFLFFLPGAFIHIDPTFAFVKNTRILYEDQQLNNVCKPTESLNTKALMLSAMQLYHPLAQCGIPLVSVFNDVFFYNKTAQRKNSQKVRDVYAGKEGWQQVAEELKARYLYWGSLEKADFESFSTQDWKNSAKKIHEENGAEIYDLGDMSALGPEPKHEEGLWASLYNNRSCEGKPVKRRLVSGVNFDLKDEGDRVLLKSPFGILFEGEIYIPQSGKIIFYLGSDDGSRLEINNQPVIDHLGDHSFLIKSGEREYQNGWYPFKLTYDNAWGMARVSLWWKLEGQKESYIDPSYFRPISYAHKK